MTERRLYRSRTDRMVSGVCGGIAEYFDIDPTLVRLGAVALVFLTSGVVILIYVVMAIVVPEAPAEGETPSPRAMTSEEIAAGARSFGDDVAEAARRVTRPGGNVAGGAGAASGAAAGVGVAGKVAEQPPTAGGSGAADDPELRRRRSSGAGLLLGLVLVLLGAGLLFSRLTGIDVLALGWRYALPAVVIAVGLLMILRSLRRD